VQELSGNAGGFTNGLIALITLVTVSGFIMTALCLHRCKTVCCKKKTLKETKQKGQPKVEGPDEEEDDSAAQEEVAKKAKKAGEKAKNKKTNADSDEEVEKQPKRKKEKKK